MRKGTNPEVKMWTHEIYMCKALTLTIICWIMVLVGADFFIDAGFSVTLYYCNCRY